MGCKETNELFMQYMDGTLDEKRAKQLRKHMDACKMCQEDFAIYDEILTEFQTETVLIEAPEGFEVAVMGKIQALETVRWAESRHALMDNFLIAIFSLFSLLFGTGFLFTLNRAAVLSYMMGNDFLVGYAMALEPIIETTERFTAQFSDVASRTLLSAQAFTDSYKYIFLAIAIVLVLAQSALQKRVTSK